MGAWTAVPIQSGDRVRAIETADGQFTKGAEYVVDYVDGRTIKVVADDAGGRNGWDMDFFLPVTPQQAGPVRTVTRRVIVPGRYGAVVVGEQEKAGTAHLVWRHNDLSPSELREAARIFNEIADVLEEQS